MMKNFLIGFIVTLLILLNIGTCFLLVQFLINTENQTVATVVGYFATKDYCFFNQWGGGAYVKYTSKNKTCTTQIDFEGTCANTENATIALVQKLHPLNSIINGATRYNHCHFHEPRGILWLRALFFSISTLLTFLAIVFIIIRYRRYRLDLERRNVHELLYGNI
jgi:hypothetical protein